MKRIVVAAGLSAVLLITGVGYGLWRSWDQFSSVVSGQRCWLSREGDEPLTLTTEQARLAAIIVAESMRRQLPERAAVIALATAWQESSLRNLSYGDRDSRGLFQQRPSQGWGTEQQVMDPWYSAGAFYERLVKVNDWQSRPVTEVAQAVQISAYPDAYAKHERNATALAGALRGSRPAALSCSNGTGSPSNAEALRPLVESVPGAAFDNSGATATITATDERSLWAAVQLAVATTRNAGMTRATVGSQTMEVSHGDQAWVTTAQPAAPGTATIELGSP